MKMGEKKISKSYNRVKVSPHTIKATLDKPIKIRQQRSNKYNVRFTLIKEHILAKVYNKIIYKLRKYKMKLLK